MLKKTLNTFVAVTFLSSLADAADLATRDTAGSQPAQQRVGNTNADTGKKPDAATDAAGSAEHKDTSKHGFKKKSDLINRPKPTPGLSPAPNGATDTTIGPQQDEDATKHGFKKKAEDIDRPGPTADVAPPPKSR